MRKLLFFFVAFSLSLGSLFAQSGKYLEFDGVERYMKIPNHADFNITTAESFTASMWIYVPELVANKNSRFMSKRNLNTTLADKSGYEFFGGNSTSQFCGLNTPNAAGNHNNSVSKWMSGQAGKWTHIAFVVDRAAGKISQ